MTLATIAEAQQLFAQGKGLFNLAIGATPGAGTAAAAASGGYSVQISINSIGTTLPDTRVGYQLPTGTNQIMFTEMLTGRGTLQTVYLCHLYTIGTLNLAATGDQFTHNAATFPILRTEFGEASKPLTLIPIVYINDAGTATAPVFSMKTNAGGAGYVDQDGNNVVATRTMTLPSATAAVQSAYLFRLEDGDSGVRDVTQIDVDTASGSAATAVIFGAEVICDITNVASIGHMNAITNGLSYQNLRPGAATSGTATSVLAIVSFGSVATTANFPTIIGVVN